MAPRLGRWTQAERPRPVSPEPICPSKRTLPRRRRPRPSSHDFHAAWPDRGGPRPHVGSRGRCWRGGEPASHRLQPTRRGAADDRDGSRPGRDGVRSTGNAGSDLDCGMTDKVRHVGVIFIHGIGSQAAGETLRDWGGVDHPCAGAVPDRRGGAGRPGRENPARCIDGQAPLHRGRATRDQGQPGKVLAQPEHWVMTEAWWAQRVSPPPFSQMAQWLGPGRRRAPDHCGDVRGSGPRRSTPSGPPRRTSSAGPSRSRPGAELESR